MTRIGQDDVPWMSDRPPVARIGGFLGVARRATGELGGFCPEGPERMKRENARGEGGCCEARPEAHEIGGHQNDRRDRKVDDDDDRKQHRCTVAADTEQDGPAKRSENVDPEWNDESAVPS